MPEEQAPPVVAVVVASDPGPWFEDCLAALSGQDYPNLDVLVIDDGGEAPLTPRVAAVLPSAFVRRLELRVGYAAAANEALGAVEGATHLLFCHDDVAPAPDAVRRLVEEAFRSNAGIAGPKYVEWDAPDRLLQVGLGVDRLGTPVPRVESGELDQAQHDEVREVFAVSGGCTLVRFDLFTALEGYDDELAGPGEDVDLCWRAQIAGARVVVVPVAVVRHREASASGERAASGEPLEVTRRVQLRLVRKNYDVPRRVVAVTRLVVVSFAEALAAVFAGDRGRAASLRAAFSWDFHHRAGLRRRRRRVRHSRRVADGEVARLFSPRARRPLHPLDGDDAPVVGEAAAVEADEWSDLTVSDETLWTRLRPGTRATIVVAALALVSLFSVRGLVFGHLPLVGQLVSWPAPSSLLGHFFGGWSDAGWQHTGPAPTAFGIVGGVGLVTFNSTAQATKLLLFVPIAVGAIGMYRLLRPLGSRRAGVVATIAYLGLPLVWNDIAAGDLQALVAYGAMPFVLGRLARASRLAPYEPAGDVPGGWRGLLGDMAPFGLLLALAGSLSPPLVVATAGLVVGLALASLVTGGLRGFGRAALVGLGALVIAMACCLPWSLTFLASGARWSVLAGAVGGRGSTVGIAAMLRMAVGPIGAGWLGWGIVLAAGYALFVAQGPRLAWAARYWVAALCSVLVAYAGSVGWLGAGGGATEVLLAPAACCLAGAVGLAVASFETDLHRSRFGWRQGGGVVVGVLLAAGLLPTFVSSFGGRSGLPSVGYEQVLSWTAPVGSSTGYQVAWLGEPATIPTPAWQIRRGEALAVSFDGLPDGTRLWPSADPGVGSQVAAAVERAEQGQTVRLGTALALAGVRYVVVPTAVAPYLPGEQTPRVVAPAPSLIGALRAQVDLRELPTEGGVIAFANAAWPAPGTAPGSGAPVPALAAEPAPLAPWLRSLLVVVGLLAVLAALAEGVRRRRRARRRSRPGALPADDLGRDGVSGRGERRDTVDGGEPAPAADAPAPALVAAAAATDEAPATSVAEPAEPARDEP